MRFNPVPLQNALSVGAGLVAGFAVLLGAEVPTSRILTANLILYPLVPWAPLFAALFLYFAWQYLNGRGWPPESAEARQRMLRSRTLPPRVWLWSLISGGLGIATWGALALLIAHLGGLGMVRSPDCCQVPLWTIACVVLMRAITEGIFEEAAFRGYIQTTLEKCCGPATAILLTAALFAAVEFLRDSLVAVWIISFGAGLILSLIAYLTGSIRPGMALHVGTKLAFATSWVTHLSGESERSIFTISMGGIILAVTTIAAFRRLDTTVLHRAGEFHEF